MNTKNNPLFFPGLGERKKQYKNLSKYFTIFDIDWNNIKLPRKNYQYVVGFSMGAVLACEYSEKHMIDVLVLCSMTPIVHSLKTLKVKSIFFLVGEKEVWKDAVLENYNRLSKEINCKCSIEIVKGADHKINKEYRLAIINKFKP